MTDEKFYVNNFAFYWRRGRGLQVFQYEVKVCHYSDKITICCYKKVF